MLAIQTCCLQRCSVVDQWPRLLGGTVVGVERPKLVVQRPRRHETAGWKPLLASCIVGVCCSLRCALTITRDSNNLMLSIPRQYLQLPPKHGKVQPCNFTRTHPLIDCGDRAQPKQKGASCAKAYSQLRLVHRAASLELDYDTAALPGVHERRRLKRPPSPNTQTPTTPILQRHLHFHIAQGHLLDQQSLNHKQKSTPPPCSLRDLSTVCSLTATHCAGTSP
jgi:hypothetical protein